LSTSVGRCGDSLLHELAELGGLGLPAEQEEVSSAETAAAGPQQPEEGVFDGVAHADISEFDRLAMRTVGGKPDEIRIHL
jgi:hypothetical protein